MIRSKASARFQNRETPAHVHKISISKSEFHLLPESTSGAKPRQTKNTSCWCMPRRVRVSSSTGKLSGDRDCKCSEKGAKKTTYRIKRRKQLDRIRHIQRLARPRVIKRHSRHNIDPFKVNKYAIKYNISQRTAKLATPRVRVTLEKNPMPATTIVPKQCSLKRIFRLAEPRIRDSPLTLSLGKINERVLHAKVSKRVSELATPRRQLDKENGLYGNHDPFKVIPRALKATCSSRIEMLARPRIISHQNVHI